MIKFTIILSLSIIVCKRCAIVMTVHSLNESRIAFCINESVLVIKKIEDV